MSEDGDSIGEGGERVRVAEYVLGLLPAAEHTEMALRIAADPALQREQRLWESRLHALDGGFAETPAPPGTLAAIERRLFGAEPRAEGWAALWSNLVVWRGVAAAAVLVAVAALAINLLRPPPSTADLANQLVAALDAQGSDVKFVAFYSPVSGTVRLVGLGGAAVPDKDYELWYIHGQQAPVSMGVIPVDSHTRIILDPKARAALEPGTVLAVTLEPKGGSPTGSPTGPIVAKGAATAI